MKRIHWLIIPVLLVAACRTTGDPDDHGAVFDKKKFDEGPGAAARREADAANQEVERATQQRSELEARRKQLSGQVEVLSRLLEEDHAALDRLAKEVAAVEHQKEVEALRQGVKRAQQSADELRQDIQQTQAQDLELRNARIAQLRKEVDDYRARIAVIARIG